MTRGFQKFTPKNHDATTATLAITILPPRADMIKSIYIAGAFSAVAVPVAGAVAVAVYRFVVCVGN